MFYCNDFMRGGPDSTIPSEYVLHRLGELGRAPGELGILGLLKMYNGSLKSAYRRLTRDWLLVVRELRGGEQWHGEDYTVGNTTSPHVLYTLRQ